MPPELSAVLAGLSAGAGRSEFAAVEMLLGGSFSGLAEIRRTPVATVDAAGLTSAEIGDWLLALPIGRDAELHVAWIADRLGARMSLGTLAAGIGELWFPAMDDIAAVLPSGSSLLVLVLDHEEIITLSAAKLAEAALHGPECQLAGGGGAAVGLRPAPGTDQGGPGKSATGTSDPGLNQAKEQHVRDRAAVTGRSRE